MAQRRIVTEGHCYNPAKLEQQDFVAQLLSEADSALLAALPTLDLGPPEVCLFDDMTEFRPLFSLS